jgi:hypothetical protein
MLAAAANARSPHIYLALTLALNAGVRDAEFRGLTWARHTLITDLAESGAGDQTIMDIAGHVSKRMLRHYSHIRMEAKRTALESIVRKKTNAVAGQTVDSRSSDESKNVGYSHRAQVYRNGNEVKSKPGLDCPESPTTSQHFEGEYPHKSPQSVDSEVHRGVVRNRKSKKIIGSSGRTRTYNPSVNSRMLCH